MVDPIWGNDPEFQTCHPLRRNWQPSEPPSSSAAAPWTSARCNRLLRPLSSKIAALKKERQMDVGQDRTAQETPCHNGHSANDGSGGIARSHGGLPSHSGGATSILTIYRSDEWASSPRPTKKIKRTYSSKTRSGCIGDANQNGNQVETLPPPRVTEIGLPPEFAPTSSQTDIAHSGPMKQNPQPLSRIEWNAIRELHTHTASVQSRLIDGVWRGLQAILQATSKSEISSSIGSCSLFSTCLRRIPSYIKEEELLAKMDDPANGDDIASVVYNDLEELGSMAGAGWSPLKDVVRAHGVVMISEAIEDGTLGLNDARHMSFLCLAAAAFDEAQTILESIVKSQMASAGHSSKRFSVDEAQMVYDSISKFALKTGRHGFLYSQMATMLENGMLPLDWISSQCMISCWNGVIQSITQQDKHIRSATALLQTSLSQWYKRAGTIASSQVHDLRLRICKSSQRPGLRPVASMRASKATDTELKFSDIGNSKYDNADSGLCSTVSSILTVFSAISLLKNSDVSSNPDDALGTSSMIIHDLAVKVRQALELVTYNFDSRHASNLILERLRLSLMAAGMVRMTDNGSMPQLCPSNLEHFTSLAELPNSGQTFSSAGSFLCAVARCCATARSDDGLGFIQAMVDNLMVTSKSGFCDQATRRLLGQIALAAAFEFAESTSQPSHLNWALKVELAVSGTVNAPGPPSFEKTPARGIKQSRTGYRWEEGICEWIAKTPALVVCGPSRLESKSIQVDDAAETPVLKVPQRIPLLSELTPCAMNKKLARSDGWPPHGKVESVNSCVKATLGEDGEGIRLEELRLAKSYHTRQRSHKNMTKPIEPQKTYTTPLDDEVDELCTPESSQENELAFPTVRAFPNMPNGIKRNKRAGPSGSYRHHCKHQGMRPVSSHRFEVEDISDIEDELGFS